jgi:DHA2 family multidrug resistance protein
MTFLIGLNIYVMAFLTPMFLGEIRGYTPMDIGKVMGMQGLSMFLSAPLGAALLNRVGARQMMAAGLLVLVFGTWLTTRLTTEWGFNEFLLAQLLTGTGMLFATLPLNNFTLATLPADEIKNASALFNLTRNVGGAIGLAVLVSAMHHQSWQHWQNLIENVRSTRWPVREQLASMSGALHPSLGADSRGGAIGLLAQQVQQQTMVMTFADMYWLLMLSLLMALPMVALLRQPQHQSDDFGLH